MHLNEKFAIKSLKHNNPEEAWKYVNNDMMPPSHAVMFYIHPQQWNEVIYHNHFDWMFIILMILAIHAQLNVQTSGGKTSILLNKIMGEINEWKV